ncbi:MAG: zinc transporter ZntB, partial [Pseudomonadales bacterium]|nr:zinc transporter ZntB [Pseudomonadales bacterium]
MIHALKFDGKGGGQSCDLDTPSSDGAVWLHFDYNEAETAEWLRNREDIDAVVAESLLLAETRPRTFAMDDGLMLALRGVNLNPGSDPEDMVSIRLWIHDNRIVSTRARRLLSVTTIVDRLENGTGPKNVAEFLLQL